MTDKLKDFINDNLNLINENTKESWEKIYEKIYDFIKGEFTKTILDAGINDPATIMGYIPGQYLYTSKIENYKIPDNVIDIGQAAFFGCDHLTSVVIGSGVTSIDDGAFNMCSSLTSVEIPDGVTHIGERAFCDCSSLTSIVVPDSITYVGQCAFGYCNNLNEIQYKGTKNEALNMLEDRNKDWRDKSSIKKIICIDGIIEL